MAEYGITATGVSVPRLIDYLDALDASFEADTGIDLDSANEDNARDIMVRVNGYLASILGELGGQLQAIVDIIDPDKATGVQLTSLARIVGVARIRATRSQVTLTITGTAGAEFGAGQLIGEGGGRNGVLARWELTEDVTLTGGTADAVFQCTEAGAIPGPAGQITGIVTPLAGQVTSLVNATDAAIGVDEETDGALRIRMRQGRARNAGCGVPGVRSRILALVDSSGAQFVQACLIVANGDSNPTAVNGIALDGNSYLVVVLPDPLTTEQQQLVLGVLYDSVVGTSKSMGTDVDGTVVNLASGIAWPVSFDYGSDITVTVALGAVVPKRGWSNADMRAAVGAEIQRLLPRPLGGPITLVEVCGAVRDSEAVATVDVSQILLNGVNADYEPILTERIVTLDVTVNGTAVPAEG